MSDVGYRVEFSDLKSAHWVSRGSGALDVRPGRAGRILIGSSGQYGAEHGDVDTAILVRMLQWVEQYVPGLGQKSAIRAWTGFPATALDTFPLIGPTRAAKEHAHA